MSWQGGHPQLIKKIKDMLATYKCKVTDTGFVSTEYIEWDHNNWEQQKIRNKPDLLVEGKTIFYIEAKNSISVEPIQWYINLTDTYKTPVMYATWDKGFMVNSPSTPKQLITNDVIIYHRGRIDCEKEIRNIRPNVKFLPNPWPKKDLESDDMKIYFSWKDTDDLDELLEYKLK